ncbi:DNA-binding transcriptional regulator, MarR family [Microlunatus sagamiharensis]|uniref:DNA-binding transcriptional regulator, MarR family n=1 Tax=Microlunatus sagamiharensis TaxID=546874 RepID=A0A1H2LGI4_9ACTN|nr:MarR family winged helix-turn-helix transcriptional regulator [Microlunatus sagamiharensis]SDU79845.1 DNA-binding transcriptional regulator, MarR family [Microlunatus sagamiharensis]
MATLQEVGLAVKRLQWRHHRAANQGLATLGLSLVQWDVLRHLDAQPEASLHDLAQLTFQTDQSMGALAVRMVERGLLERVGGPGRAVRHRLTGRGEEVRGAGSAVLDEVLRESFGGLAPDQLDRLHDLLSQALATAGASAR